ncbi:PAS domain-containing protein [Anabaena catenula]|uniref:PAS domain-containing protein n=1 Tax=Anabaena catenula FACHB-362 TaxID=2692877 RepID=A0ABR8J9B3_9NOST|nr:PAS domain-containing protein [Anabaena catenula FACHB-362]
MNIEKFVQRAELLHQRLADLHQTASVLPWIPSDLVPEAFKELYTTSKILQLEVQELYQHNEELIQTHKLLEADRQHYQHLFEFAPDAYLVTNAKGIILEANRAATKLLNISQHFLVGKSIISFITLEQHQYFYEQLIQISKSQKVRGILLPLKPHHGNSFKAALTVTSAKHQPRKSSKLYWLIRDISEYQPRESATVENQKNLIEHRPVHKYSKGETISLNPLLIWYVCKGVVKLSTFCETDQEVLTGLATEEMVFGSSMTSLPIYQATALTDVELVSIYLSEITLFSAISHTLLPKIQQRLQQTESFLVIAGRRRVKDRLHHLLELLKQQVGKPVPEGIRLSIRFTHEDMASSCCTTRATITRLIGKLQKQGIITFDHKKHMIFRDRP